MDPLRPSDPITLVISEVVEPSLIEEYEEWTRGINQAARQHPGFVGVEIIRPRDHANPEYVVIVKFDTYAHLKTWINSPVYRQWMAKAPNFIAARSQQELPNGLEVWFTLPSNTNHPVPQTPYYKKVVLGVLAVYPLILLADALLRPFLGAFPPLLGLLISVTFVSALLTYPVMPWLTKLLGFWLYPSFTPKRSSRRK